MYIKYLLYYINLKRETICHKFSFKATISEANKFISDLALIVTPIPAS